MVTKRMGLVAPFFVVLICLFLLSPVAAQKLTLTSSTLRNPVTIDGKWTNAIEWKDGASYLAGPYGVFVIKDDSNFLYVLVDPTVDGTATAGDFGGVSWDQKNDGGNSPKSDDYELVLTYTDETSYESSIYQGTGSRWGPSKPASSLGISSASSSNATLDPYSNKSHRIYEFQVPRSLLDNSTVVTSIGFFMAAVDGPSGGFISSPRSGDHRIPNTWAQLTFSLPVPEFPSFLIMLPVILALMILLRRERNRHCPPTKSAAGKI